MVAGQVGEGGGRQAHGVQPVLGQAVAGGLDRHMPDAGLGQLRQGLVQGHRIGRGQPRRPGQRLAVNAQGADAAGPLADGLPDLAGEAGHRRLAVGAGDGDHHVGLAAVVAGGHLGEPAARVGVQHQGRVAHVQRPPGGGQDRGRALVQRVGDEVAPVGLGAFQGGEQEAGLDRAAVGGQAGDIDAVGRPLSAQEVAQLNQSRLLAHHRVGHAYSPILA